MDPRVPFVIFTVLSAVHGTTGGLASAVKVVAWVGMLALVVADARYRHRRGEA
jgi:hypothetical protein